MEGEEGEEASQIDEEKTEEKKKQNVGEDTYGVRNEGEGSGQDQ